MRTYMVTFTHREYKHTFAVLVTASDKDDAIRLAASQAIASDLTEYDATEV